MTLSDLEMQNAKGQSLPADLYNYAGIVWPRTTTFGKVTHVGEKHISTWSPTPPSKWGEPKRPPNFCEPLADVSIGTSDGAVGGTMVVNVSQLEIYLNTKRRGCETFDRILWDIILWWPHARSNSVKWTWRNFTPSTRRTGKLCIERWGY